jgi:DNA-binding MarR family transcriptional regulator
MSQHPPTQASGATPADETASGRSAVAAPDTGQILTVAGDLRVVLGQLNRRLREQGTVGDLTQSQKSVLVRLDRDGPSTKSALARAEGVTPQSMGATIATLESAGFVGGSPDPVDGRKTVVSLTDAALEKVAAGRLAREGWLFRAISAELSPADQRLLGDAVELLSRLARHS